MKKLILIVMTLACIASLTAPVAAQQATTTPTPEPPDAAPSDVELVVNDNIAVVDYNYQNDEMVIQFYSDTYTDISVAPSAPTGSQAGTISSSTYLLDQDTTTTVRVRSPGGVSFWTSDQRYHYLRQPQSSIISGPFTGRDVQTGAATGAITVALVSIIIVVRAVTGRKESPERIA